MILQDNKGNNKIFINDNVFEYYFLDSDNTYNIHWLKANNKKDYIVNFQNEGIKLDPVYTMSLSPYNIDALDGFSKTIQDDEIVSVELDEYDILINILKLPKFLFEDDKYPKIELNLSDCIYSMRIYKDEYTYIDTPEFQSHNDINNTLEYLSSLVFYLTEGRPNFIEQLCECTSMNLLIYDKNHENVLSGGEVKYNLGENGLYLTGGELDNYLVEWHKFFKLVMDGTWEVDFIEENPKPQSVEENNNYHVCDTCANYTEPDEVDNGCYMCCKGLEDNYIPIEKE